MSSLIERATRRLEQLKQAGVVIPDTAPEPLPTAPPAASPQLATGEIPPEGPSQYENPPTQSQPVELDLDALELANIATPRAPRSLIADQFRVIKRPLISNAVGKDGAKLTHGNLIMITSALAGEGKSFTSVNLAMSIAAELDHSVMLVDADVARPSVLRMLGLPPELPGLLDILDGGASMADVLLRTNVDKLTILPSGTPHPRATELLASEAMRHFLDDISRRYPERIVIFDSPPLLLTTEARVLATQMGQVVLVVQAEQTLQADVEHALATVDACPTKMMILNKARTAPLGGYGYGYGDGYGYGYGYGRAREKQTA